MSKSKTVGILLAFVILFAFGHPMSVFGDQSYELTPVVDGVVYDAYPYDGVANYIYDGGTKIQAMFGAYYDIRAVMEFDVGSIDLRRVEQAQLQLVKVDGSIPPPDASVYPIEVYGYYGDGAIGYDDLNPGSFISLFNGFDVPDYQPYQVDVTEFLQIAGEFNWPVVGFRLRTQFNVGQVNFASLENGERRPMLILHLKDGTDTLGN